MNNQKIGVILLVLGFVLLGVFLFAFQDLGDKSEELGCFNNDECKPIERSLSILHFGFGLFGFILALGFYMVFLSSGEKALLQKLNKEENKIASGQKFDILLLGLSSFEQEVIKAVRKQSGISQNTLRLRVDMSKAKLSLVLKELEQKKLVRREQKGKTLAVHYILDY
jgi:hypothetical protein